MLVSYYSEESEKVLIQHYLSSELVYVNATSVFRVVTEALERDGIPLINLISTLSDSAGYMRGKDNGFETLLRSRVPDLLDIDGDACHHLHNSFTRNRSNFNSML